MKYIVTALAVFCLPISVFCQDISGLWTGTLYDETTHQTMPYEIYISNTNGKLTGYSQTWSVINAEKCYGIKKINIRIAKDGKIVIQDASLIENNYPFKPNKNVIQLNILDLVNDGNDANLKGSFVTNRTTSYAELKGQVSLKRATAVNESTLKQYVQKNKTGSEITSAK